MHSIQAGRSYVSMQKCWELIMFVYIFFASVPHQTYICRVRFFCFSRKEEREYDWCKSRAGTVGIGTEE